MARISGGVVAFLLVVLLALMWVASTSGERMVVPTESVIDGEAADEAATGNTDIGQALAERTTMQLWPGETSSVDLQAAGMIDGGIADPRGLVRGWLSDETRYTDILRDRGFLRGEVNLPDDQAAVLQQPGGRDWRRLHNDEVTYGGGWIIFGFSLLLALFLAIRGRIPIKHGFSGRTIERFGGFERFNHWMTAGSFILVALSGLILLYGQYFLKPLIGPGAYGAFATGNAYVHMAFALPFVLGVAVMIVMWLRQNLPSRIDLAWLRKGGGFLSTEQDNPPARRFNTGQKLIFWAVAGGAVLLLVSGLSLMLPFVWLGIDGMQWMQLAHATVGLLLIAVIIGHIYIGTIGMVGAFDAMWSGKVDTNWAEEHHSLWVEKLKQEGQLDDSADRPDKRRAAA